MYLPGANELSRWDQVMHICVSKLSILGSDNGLSPGRRQAIIRTNAGILLIGTLGTNFSEILGEIHTFSFKKMHLKMSSGRWWPFCLSLNVLSRWVLMRSYAIKCHDDQWWVALPIILSCHDPHHCIDQWQGCFEVRAWLSLSGRFVTPLVMLTVKSLM